MLKSTFKLFIFTFVLNFAFLISAATNCTITSNNAAFGNFAPLNYASQTISTTFTVNCTATIAATVSGTITFAKGNSGSFNPRAMNSNANLLSYNLYKDSACTQILGDGTGGTYTYTLSGSLNIANLNSMTVSSTFYSRIPSQPTAAKGSYTDSIIITLTYQ